MSSSPIVTHQLHHISPHWLTYYEGDLHKGQKEIQLTPCLCLLGRHWAHLSPLKEKYLHVKEQGTLLPWGAAPQEEVWGFSLFVEVWWGAAASVLLPCCILSSWDSQQPHQSVAEVLLLHLSVIARRGSNSWTACFTTLGLFMETELTAVLYCLCK